MGTTAAPAVAASPAHIPGTLGLLSLARTPNADPANGGDGSTTTPDDRWINGFTFAPETFDPAQTIPYDCSVHDKLAPANPDLTVIEPYLLVGGDECSTLGGNRDREGRARRHLVAASSDAIEHEWWTGAAVPTNPSLTDGTADVISAVAVEPFKGLALLDQALTACLRGGIGMVHVTPYTLTRWGCAGGGPLRWAGDRWLTPNGHVVVAGSGYTGGGPRPAPGGVLPAAPDLTAVPTVDQWAYASPFVYLRLSDPLTFGDQGARLNRANNVETFLAERFAAAYSDPTCKFAILLDTST